MLPLRSLETTWPPMQIWSVISRPLLPLSRYICLSCAMDVLTSIIRASRAGGSGYVSVMTGCHSSQEVSNRARIIGTAYIFFIGPRI